MCDMASLSVVLQGVLREPELDAEALHERPDQFGAQGGVVLEHFEHLLLTLHGAR